MLIPTTNTKLIKKLLFVVVFHIWVVGFAQAQERIETAEAEFKRPIDVVYDGFAADVLTVSEENGHRIRKIE